MGPHLFFVFTSRRDEQVRTGRQTQRAGPAPSARDGQINTKNRCGPCPARVLPSPPGRGEGEGHQEGTEIVSAARRPGAPHPSPLPVGEGEGSNAESPSPQPSPGGRGRRKQCRGAVRGSARQSLFDHRAEPSARGPKAACKYALPARLLPSPPGRGEGEGHQEGTEIVSAARRPGAPHPSPLPVGEGEGSNAESPSPQPSPGGRGRRKRCREPLTPALSRWEREKEAMPGRPQGVTAAGPLRSSRGCFRGARRPG
jgi:hypothetical protein